MPQVATTVTKVFEETGLFQKAVGIDKELVSLPGGRFKEADLYRRQLLVLLQEGRLEEAERSMECPLRSYRCHWEGETLWAIPDPGYAKLPKVRRRL